MARIIGPPWLDVDRWDASRNRQPTQAKTDRFHLVAHKETRPREGYALTVAKDGPKLPTVTEITGADVSVTQAGVDINEVNPSAFATCLRNLWASR